MAKTPRDHIEEIRRVKFSIGGEPNPLTEDLHQAVKNLSAELYAKDVHFLMELIQNAEDNEYEEGVKPSLEFVITSKDITATGAPATLLIFNNERGFSARNIDSICSIGRSTKKGNRRRGYIGEKGIGFKSVFLITAQPYIFSNGYQIRFSEEPCPECSVGYVVPTWVEENPSISDIIEIYGSGKNPPTTCMVLPLKPGKVKPVKQQLSSVHPEVLLFLTKIKQLSVREDNEDPKSNTVSAISISSEANFVTRKDIDAESYLLHLTANEKGNEVEECSYHMWRQRFPVKLENRADAETRMDVEEWVITLAFPNGDRLHGGTSSPGIYAFLPTEMVTNFPFIIQADFILASSRETILLDKPWNQGILNCVPEAFVKAFISLVKGTEYAPVSSLPRMFSFLPIISSPYSILNSLRESIKQKLMNENIIPCESYTKQKIFQKPCEVGRLLPAFWDLLNKGREQGVRFDNISSHGRHILCSAFDMEKYNSILMFLGLTHVDAEWYVKCIRSSNFILRVSEDVYLDLLLFLAGNWNSTFMNSGILGIPLLKYVSVHGTVSISSINEALQLPSMLVSYNNSHISWMIDWNQELRCPGNGYFLLKATQELLHSTSKGRTVLEWLVKKVNVKRINMSDYARLILESLVADRELVLGYVHFLFHSFGRNLLSAREIDDLCANMLIINKYRQVVTCQKGVLVPANGSKWLQLIGSNLWRNQDYMELAEDYLYSGYHAGHHTSGKELMEFLKEHLGASDIPDVSPPNCAIPSVHSQLTKENAFLLLDWIHNMQRRGIHIPGNFLRSIKEGSWMKISVNGISGCRPPSQSFLLEPKWVNLLQNGSVLVDIPLIDQNYYDNRIKYYSEELRTLGVMFDFGEACQYIGRHLMSLAESSILTRGNVLSILQFIKFLRERLLPTDDFVESINCKRWLRTCQGDKRPEDSVFFSEEWRAASHISNIPFLDKDYYGEEILSYKKELQLLGVVFDFNNSYQLLVDNLKSPDSLTSFNAEAVLLVLECMRHLDSPRKLVSAIQDKKFLKTNAGLKSPAECFLFDPQWGCLLQVFNSFPLIDENFYGQKGLLSFKSELKQLGVIVDFEKAMKSFASVFRKQASLSSINKNNVLLFLSCYGKLKKSLVFPDELKSCINEVQWLRTRLGVYKSPKECILFDPDWESISSIALLPFIDDSDNHYSKEIHNFKEDLKSMGVVVSFSSGVKFVPPSLRLPEDSRSLDPVAAYALLECTRLLQEKPDNKLLMTFVEKVQKKWIKTHAGHKSPKECLLFGSDWSLVLWKEDGPFIDEGFYGHKIRSYEKELRALGVVVDVHGGCQLVASHLDLCPDMDAIIRIYKYLDKYDWEPTGEDTKRIWIPNGNQEGEWVSSEECVLHDKNGLFGFQLKVLEKHYQKDVLGFFSKTLGVKSNPSLDDFCKLWKSWEDSDHRLSCTECVAFWRFVLKHWNAKTEKVLGEKLLKIPGYSSSDGIVLLDKQDVLIADDLYLKDHFEQSYSRPLFVWYPQKHLQDLPRAKLLDIYAKIGVKTLSESVQTEKVSALDDAHLAQVNPKDIFITRGLFKLILGFLNDPSLEMELEKKHESLKCLLSSAVLETLESMTVKYSLTLSSGEVLDVKASRVIRWERQKSKIFSHKFDKSGGHKDILEYATNFAEVVSGGLLWGKEDHIHQLAELIKLGFVMEFDEAAIDFLMKTKNLEIFLEDEEFLSSAFP
ncbi:hypothetical protein M9H77_33850 [Catharanthus roseus]|uniref:Uncharacterized protein n=2 Tax=Catharanthus roseus TaxID=4058 RepID=A0ACB9ZJG5_CATRO|nr:hypothetical protein M9H77_33846 [Catharanthus roseus]KAI5647845.1 hypothetical protein M9H77_33850 [Catharanthus roseus]